MAVGQAFTAARLRDDLIDSRAWTGGSYPERFARYFLNQGFDPDLQGVQVSAFLAQQTDEGPRPVGEPVFVDILLAVEQEGWISPNRSASQDTIASTVKAGLSRESLQRPFGQLRARGDISNTVEKVRR